MATPATTIRVARIPLGALQSPSQAPSRIFAITRWGLVATLLAAPLAFGAVQPWAWAALLIAAFALLLLWAIGNVRQETLTIHWSLLYLPAALFLALALGQYYAGRTLDAYATREAIFKFVTVLVFFFLAGQLFAQASRAVWSKFGLGITLYAFAVGLFAILQFFTSRNLIYWTVQSKGWTFGPYVNRNDYAGLMEMLIPIAAAYVLSRPREDPQRVLLAFSLCVPLASVMLSGSRGGFIALLVETFVLGWILWRRQSGRSADYLQAMLALAITAAVLLFFWIAPKAIVQRLNQLANVSQTVEVTYGQRKVATIDALHIFRDHPWTGTGLGSFDTVFPRYRTFPTDLGWSHAHNDYAEALAETGIAGGILILLTLFFFFKRAFRNLRRRHRNAAGWIQLGATLGCCGLLIHSFADFNLHIPANAAWFVVLMAIATARGTDSMRDSHPSEVASHSARHRPAC